VQSAVSTPPGSLQNCLPATAQNLPSSSPVDIAVAFDGLGRLTAQTIQGANRRYTYDGLSRLKAALGPWERPLGYQNALSWTYTYDALGNLLTQTSSRGSAGDNRTWSYTDATRPHLLTSFTQVGTWTETITPTAFGEPAQIARSPGSTDALQWNAQGKLYQVKSSIYSYDAFDQNTLVVTGAGASQTSIVRVGDDFEYDVVAGRATKYFSVDGVRIAVLATNYTAQSASIPPALQPIVRGLEPLEAPLAAGFVLLGLVSLVGVATRRRAPAWVAVPGVTMLSLVLVGMPLEAYAATLPSGGPGKFGRPAEKFLAYLTDHLGSVRAVVNQNGVVVETRDYDPFGGDVTHVGAFSTQHRFTGQPADDQGRGLYNYGARFYNAKWGRFISPDEVTQGFDSQGLHPYAYLLNGPTNGIDPDGHQFEFPPISIPAIAAFASGLTAGSWSTGGLGTAGSVQGGHALGAHDPTPGELILWLLIPGLGFVISWFDQPSDYTGGGGGGGGGGAPGVPPLGTPDFGVSLGVVVTAAGTPTIGLVSWPTGFRVVIQPFIPGIHDGVDIRARLGTDIYAAAEGTVIAVYSNAKGGGQVKVEHNDGSVTGYAHIQPSVSKGQHVQSGQAIGKSDGSGHGTGPHLHFTYRTSGSASKSDPMQLLGGP
jgi:RHS repeat-associated protein